MIVAILWLGGRFYMAGYFGAMNIPAFQINFSVWEYAEAAWSRVIIYFLRQIFIPRDLGVFDCSIQSRDHSGAATCISKTKVGGAPGWNGITGTEASRGIQEDRRICFAYVLYLYLI